MQLLENSQAMHVCNTCANGDIVEPPPFYFTSDVAFSPGIQHDLKPDKTQAHSKTKGLYLLHKLWSQSCWDFVYEGPNLSENNQHETRESLEGAACNSCNE